MPVTASTTTTEVTEITKTTPQSDGTIIHLPAALLRPFCVDKNVPAEVKDSKTLLNALRYEGQLVRGNTRAERIEWMPLDPNALRNKAYWKEDFDFFKTDPQKPYPWKPITDGWMLNLRDKIKGKYYLLDGKPLAYSKAEIMECLTALAYVWDYDPFLSDFIYDLPKWDGRPRMDTLLTECLELQTTKSQGWTRFSGHVTSCV